MNEKLRTCPFCDGEASARTYPESGKYRIACKACHVKTALFDTMQEAINAWNRRAQPANKPEESVANHKYCRNCKFYDTSRFQEYHEKLAICMNPHSGGVYEVGYGTFAGKCFEARNPGKEKSAPGRQSEERK